MNLESLQSISLSVVHERSLETVLGSIVERLCDINHVALARVWLIQPSDRCDQCPMRPECPDQSRCLHLAASHGQPTQPEAEPWRHLQGAYSRYPLGVGKVGRIGARSEAILLTDLDDGGRWLGDSDWARRERVRSFAGQPLVFRGEIFGVLGLFSRLRLDQSVLTILRTFADQVASAMAYARSYTEVLLRQQDLLVENERLRRALKEAQERGEGPPPLLSENGILTYPELERLERSNLLTVLRKTHWRVSGPNGAAALLGVKPTTLASRIKAMELVRPR